MIVPGLALGVLLVIGSIVQNRWVIRYLTPDERLARTREIGSWGLYLGIAALIYVGFALREDGRPWMPVELAGLVGYGLLGALGAARWPVLIPLGWALHAGWDALLHGDVSDSFVPTWYRWACLSYDVVAAAYLGWLTRSPAEP